MKRGRLEKFRPIATKYCHSCQRHLPKRPEFWNKHCPFCRSCVSEGREIVDSEEEQKSLEEAYGRGECVNFCSCGDYFRWTKVRDGKVCHPEVWKGKVEETDPGPEKCPRCRMGEYSDDIPMERDYPPFNPNYIHWWEELMRREPQLKRKRTRPRRRKLG